MLEKVVIDIKWVSVESSLFFSNFTYLTKINHCHIVSFLPFLPKSPPGLLLMPFTCHFLPSLSLLFFFSVHNHLGPTIPHNLLFILSDIPFSSHPLCHLWQLFCNIVAVFPLSLFPLFPVSSQWLATTTQPVIDLLLLLLLILWFYLITIIPSLQWSLLLYFYPLLPLVYHTKHT